jgi:hypothetical protein
MVHMPFPIVHPGQTSQPATQAVDPTSSLDQHPDQSPARHLLGWPERDHYASGPEQRRAWDAMAWGEKA